MAHTKIFLGRYLHNQILVPGNSTLSCLSLCSPREQNLRWGLLWRRCIWGNDQGTEVRDKIDRNGKKFSYVIEHGHCCRQDPVRESGPRLLKICVERTGAISAPKTVKGPSSHKGQRLPAKSCSQPFILSRPLLTLVTSSTFSIPVPQLQSCRRKMCR